MLDREQLMRRYAPRLFGAQLWDLLMADVPEDTTEPEPETHTGVMVAFYLDPPVAQQLALEGAGEKAEELHLTLAYLGEVGRDITTDRLPLLWAAVSAWAAQTQPIDGVISGVGVFANDDSTVTYASVDAPALAQARQDLVGKLAAAGFALPSEHGYTPHVTLAYDDVREVNPARLPVSFDTATVAFAGQRRQIPLGVTPQQARAHVQEDRRPVSEGQGSLVTGTWNPILTTVGTKTFLTAPATTQRAAMWGQPPSPNPHMLWMQGRFVGAEKPNRNNALWSVQDLEMGQPTVTHGPLNWLHQDRHIIGSIADATFVPSRTGESADASGIPEAHITALAGIWRWLYPDEASVVEMASDSGMLAYSMECISDQVECVHDVASGAGCGKSFSYMEFSQGLTCEHLKDRASVRRLVNPTFLGGAVIVPPTRPGWADAQASVLPAVASMAEKAYEQAGRPDIPAATWEHMMASVLSFAGADQVPTSS